MFTTTIRNIISPGTKTQDPLIPDLRSRIQHPQNKRRGEKFVVLHFFCSHKYYKIENYFIFEQVKKKI
jgi:hypothetical protein